SSRCSSRCRMVPRLSCPICVDQPLTGPGQRGAYSPPGKPQGLGNLLVIEPFGLEEERLAIPVAKLIQGCPDRRPGLLPVQVVLGRGRCRRGLRPEKLQPPALADCPAPILPNEIQRHGKQPGPGVSGRGGHG